MCPHLKFVIYLISEVSVHKVFDMVSSRDYIISLVLSLHAPHFPLALGSPNQTGSPSAPESPLFPLHITYYLFPISLEMSAFSLTIPLLVSCSTTHAYF